MEKSLSPVSLPVNDRMPERTWRHCSPTSIWETHLGGIPRGILKPVLLLLHLPLSCPRLLFLESSGSVVLLCSCSLSGSSTNHQWGRLYPFSPQSICEGYKAGVCAPGHQAGVPMPVFSVNSASCLKGVIGYIWPLLTLPTKASEVCWYLILLHTEPTKLFASNCKKLWTRLTKTVIKVIQDRGKKEC